MNFLSVIESKREGKPASIGEIEDFVHAFTAEKIPDYQMAAMLMAIYFRGLTEEETRALTLAMRDSGDTLKFPKDKRPLVDKHSTGGVGDKVSLPLAPLLACLGFRVPMISGRGLGITGGTLDKLDSIPGFKTTLPLEKIIQIVQKVGCVICGQTERMVPADKKLYALRDVTGTVPSISLIVSSILSKKLAENLDALVLDVKFGTAAFMQTKAEARELAQKQLLNGGGYHKFKQVIQAQGGNPAVLDRFELLPNATGVREISSPRGGYVSAIDASDIGGACTLIGAGRDTKEAGIDPAVGVILEVKVGQKVEAGGVLCRIYHTKEDHLDEAAEMIEDAFRISANAPEDRDIILEVVG